MNLPGIADAELGDLFDVLDRLQAAWTAAGVTTQVLVGERYLNDEGAGNRVVFVPVKEIGEVTGAPINLGQFGAGKLAFPCSAFAWGAQFKTGDGEIDEKATHRSAMAIVYNLLVGLPDASGDRVQFINALRPLEPTQVDYGYQYELSFYYLYDVNRNTDLVAPGGFVIVPTTTIEDPS